MKTIILTRVGLILVMTLFISGISAYAIEPAITPAQHIQKIIKQGITYPEKAVKNCCTGAVDVIFTIDDEGNIKIEKTFAENEHVDKIVKDQLSKICCKGLKTPFNEHYRITITFKLLG